MIKEESKNAANSIKYQNNLKFEIILYLKNNEFVFFL